MNYRRATPRSHLPRLAPEWYRGKAFVLWTHAIAGRRTGWLTPEFHTRFREVMLHCCARYRLACPGYVLMPDHWHLVWCGLAEASDQLLATRFLRQYVARDLKDAALEDRAHDHVLRDSERDADRVAEACRYVRENPVRAGLVAHASEWPYGGVIVAGYPSINVNAPEFWPWFWRMYAHLRL
jgi:REP element-mobilizing transposase RayT